MIIPIQPVKVFVPGKGLVTATQVLVTVQQFELGVRCRAAYEVQEVDLKDPKAPRPITLANGYAELTPEQFAAWGADDAYAGRCIVENAGLEPVQA